MALSKPEWKLRVWKGDYGAPSLDFECLQAMAYARFNGAPVRFSYGMFPQWCPIPSFKFKGGLYTIPANMIKKIKLTLKEERDTDDHDYGTPDEASKIEAYKSYVADIFEIVHLNTFWYNENNFEKLTKPYYKRLILFPFDYFYLRRMMKSHLVKLRMIRNNELPLDVHLTSNLIEAEQCLDNMSKMLGSKPFFMGEKPCSLDAVIYGMLAPIYYAPLQMCKIRMRLGVYKNLVRFIKRVTRVYFQEVECKVSDMAYGQVAAGPEEEEYPAPWWHVTFAGIAAFGAMMWYALHSGIIRVILE